MHTLLLFFVSLFLYFLNKNLRTNYASSYLISEVYYIDILVTIANLTHTPNRYSFTSEDIGKSIIKNKHHNPKTSAKISYSI